MRFSFSPLARKRQIKWKRELRDGSCVWVCVYVCGGGRGGAQQIYILFEQQRPVVYLMITLLLLNLMSLSSLSVPINMFPLQHSWNSSRVNSPPPSSHCYSTVWYYSPITQAFVSVIHMIGSIFCFDTEVTPGLLLHTFNLSICASGSDL